MSKIDQYKKQVKELADAGKTEEAEELLCKALDNDEITLEQVRDAFLPFHFLYGMSPNFTIRYMYIHNPKKFGIDPDLPIC